MTHLSDFCNAGIIHWRCASVHQSFEVMKSSSRDLIMPRLRASFMESPRGCSDWYIAAVSKCRYPILIASRMFSFTQSAEAPKGYAAVPKPTRGMSFSVDLSVDSGIMLAIVVYLVFSGLRSLKYMFFSSQQIL